MIVIYHGESDPLEMVDGKEYRALGIECGWLRIVDETGEDYLYPADCFTLKSGQFKDADFDGDDLDVISAESGFSVDDMIGDDAKLDAAMEKVFQSAVEASDEEEWDLAEWTRGLIELLGVSWEQPE